MALPQLDNHDGRIRYYELMLEADIADIQEIPLPDGYHFALYQPGDREDWITIEQSAKEFESRDEGLSAWKRYYEGKDDELKRRMCFVVNGQGEKVATATAFYDIYGRDTSGDAWLHWVAVRSENQGKGLSKPLITHVIGIMKQLGYTHAKIPTQTTTWVACKVYLDLGFRPLPENFIHSLDGWRIIRRLTNHPALRELDAARDEEVLGGIYTAMKDELMPLLQPYHPQAIPAEGQPYWRIRIKNDAENELEIQLDDDMTLMFDFWHIHYGFMHQDNEGTFAELKRDLLAFLAGETFVYSLWTEKWEVSSQCEAGTDMKEKILKDIVLDRPMADKLQGRQTTVRCRFWHAARDCDLVLTPKDWAPIKGISERERKDALP